MGTAKKKKFIVNTPEDYKHQILPSRKNDNDNSIVLDDRRWIINQDKPGIANMQKKEREMQRQKQADYATSERIIKLKTINNFV